ncbi:MAG: exodeoxyribonuclease V subunit gamma [Methylococcales symbiont of Iophon sp. n. MRB-2018]|nr:MAG: exodeoxyribonuclease V subunit gamma [Methylococcales symbiont of Iophon sp. n. MRB-2018]KAF3979598.1 MAG: exodeoxyribonuclease V subunit gamma [Methylococcales symbiont of Iophon sp. n. MRB-2018]
MFILHSSNKTENLLAHLITVIENMPLSNPLTAETFLIQSQGMERWLSQQLASHFTIWANYQFLFPSKFFSSLAAKIDSQLNDNFFDREVMLWRFENLLRDLDKHIYPQLHHYLNAENVALKRFQLSSQLTQMFDQYQIMRPDMLELWQKGQLFYGTDNERWQRALWSQITSSIGYKHRGSLWLNVIKKLNQSKEDVYATKLPERIFVFGLNTLPPLFLDYLQSLSKHCDIHLFLLNPAQGYWADLANKKYLANDDTQGHPLLSALGQQGREFQQMLLEQAHFNHQPESYQAADAQSNLQQLQNDILNNQTTPQPLINDKSISIHACHSKMREVEVLKDQLLNALEQDSSLELRDIVVMAPDIQQYAPLISAVFNDIQHAIADRSLRLSNGVLDSFIRFLSLSQSRFGWQSVMDLLEQPLVLQKFSITESELDLIKHWVSHTQVRWGKSAAHKNQLGLPEFSQNTWQATLDRLLMGYAVGNDDGFIDGVLPYPEIEGISALVLGRLNDFIQLLFKASEELGQESTLLHWSQRLYFYANQLLSAKTSEQQNQQQQLYQLLQQLQAPSQYHTGKLTLDVILVWLESCMSESKTANGFLRGQLTFCSMLPMRSIPFKVIALLGLNEAEFPKIDRYPSFDLIGQNFRKGDRSRRSDDRYQFLEIILSARKQLIITFIGQSNRHDTEIPPSVVVSELLDVMENYYQITTLVCKHPLQAFSPRYFIDQPELFSYSQSDCKTAQSLQKNQPINAHWWQGKLKTKETTTVDINALFAFYRQPQQYFFQQQLGLRFTEISSQTEEREPFSINPLEAYSINRQWIEHLVTGKQFSLKKLQAQGLWLSGATGKLAFQQQQQSIEEFVTLIKQQELGQRQEDRQLDCMVGDYRLIGKLSNIHHHGSLIYRYSTLKGKDFMLAWLHHLMINQIQTQNTHLLSTNENLIFSSKMAQTTHLKQLIKIYIQGLQQPNAFFTETSFAYIKQKRKLKQSSRASKPAMKMAEEMLLKEVDYDRYMQQLYQTYKNLETLTEILGDDFEEQCKNLLLPVWESIQGSHNP